MEEVLKFTNHACDLARKLELELSGMTNNPDMLFLSINDVEKAFVAAKERVRMLLSQQDPAITSASMLSHDVFKQKTQETQMGGGSATTMQEYLNRCGSHATTMDQLLLMQHPFDASVTVENKMLSGGDIHMIRSSRGTLRIGEMGEMDVEGSKGSEGEMEASPSRPKKRNGDLEKRTLMLPAPQFGNTQVPPEDGFTWRKYGQKEILGRKHPRSYYRCTHQKLYSCRAKKQVQRLDENPNIVEVTLRGEHTCHKTSTAPSSYPPKDMMSSPLQTTKPSPSSVPEWLSSANLGLGGAGLSTSKYVTDYPIADMADVMFNSGSSSGNSMEYLFSPTEEPNSMRGKAEI